MKTKTRAAAATVVAAVAMAAVTGQATASPSFPLKRAAAKAAKVAARKCSYKAARQAARNRPFTRCLSSDGHSCMSGGDIGRPANEGVCVGDYVIANQSGTKSAYCSGNVYMRWTGHFMVRTRPYSPFFCLPL